jgi:hypothetical protein
MNRLFFFTIFYLTLATSLMAQEEATSRRFHGGFTYGFNASQIDGDGLAGYNKLGLYGGVVASADLTDKAYLSTAITYSQRGSSTSIRNQNSARIRLDFIEVPLIFHYKDKETEEGYHQVHVGAGLCYSRLFDVKAGSTPYLGHESTFNDTNISWLLEAMFYKNKHFGLGVRYNRAINNVYKNDRVPAPVAVFLEHWISFKGVYVF